MGTEITINSEEIVMNFIVQPEQMEELSLQIAKEFKTASVKVEDNKPSILKLQDDKNTLINGADIKIISSSNGVEKVQQQTSRNTEGFLSCTVCPYSSTLILDYKKHMRTHTGEVFYDCQFCFHSFKSKKDFNLHIKDHKTNKSRLGSFNCNICPARLKTSKSIKIHKETTHEIEKPFRCTACGKFFRSSNSFIRHTWIHDEDKQGKYKCTTCPKSFPTPGQLKQHQFYHMKDKGFPCGTCKKSFYSSQKLKNHVRIHTGERPFKCESCEKAFREKIKLERHKLIRHTDENPYSCKVCGKRFRDNYDWKKHLATPQVHVKKEKEDGNYTTKGKKRAQISNPVTCQVCSKVLFNDLRLKCHMKQHTGEGERCDTCQTFFVTKIRYEKHTKINGGCMKEARRYKCDYCPAAFKEKRHLRRHISRLHTGELPFACSICGRKFNSKFRCDQHMARVHDKQDKQDEHARDVKCHICSETFENYAKLKIHADQHKVTDANGYKCGLCNIFLRSVHAFAKHVEQHEKYSCKICSLDFAIETEFDIHLETHSDMKPTCANCGHISDSHRDFCIHLMERHNLPRVNVVKLMMGRESKYTQLSL